MSFRHTVVIDFLPDMIPEHIVFFSLSIHRRFHFSYVYNSRERFYV